MELALAALLLLFLNKSSSSTGSGGTGNPGGGAPGGGGTNNTLGDGLKIAGAGLGLVGAIGGVHLGGGAATAGGVGGAGAGITAAGGTAGHVTTAGVSATGGSGATAAGGGAAPADAIIDSSFVAAELFNPFTAMLAIWAIAIIAAVVIFDLTTAFHEWHFRMGQFIGLGTPPGPDQAVMERSYARRHANELACQLMQAVVTAASHLEANLPPQTTTAADGTVTTTGLGYDPRYTYVVQVPGDSAHSFTEQGAAQKVVYDVAYIGAATPPGAGTAALLCHYFSCWYVYWAARYEKRFINNMAGSPGNRTPGADVAVFEVEDIWESFTPLGSMPTKADGSTYRAGDFLFDVVTVLDINKNTTTSRARKAGVNQLLRRFQFAALCRGVFYNLRGDPEVYFPWDANDYAQKRFTALELLADDCNLQFSDQGDPTIVFGESWYMHKWRNPTTGEVAEYNPEIRPYGFTETLLTKVHIVHAKDGWGNFIDWEGE